MKLLMKIFFILFTIPLILIMLFFILSKKFLENKLMSSTFECGYSSYFFSRFSFSMHYYLTAMIFLFFDLELCFIMPFFHQYHPSSISPNLIMFFILILVLGLLEEWKSGMLDWKFWA